MNGKFEDFKITTRVRSLNLWIQILLGIALYAGLNFAASRHYQRFDMSENRRNSLSPESVAYVKNLRKPVEIYAVVSMGRSDNESAAIVRDFNTLFRQYEYASNKTAPVSAKFVNAHIENKRAEELAARFGSDLEECVIVASGNKFKRIPILEFYGVEDGARRDFKGESLISSAILNVSAGRDTKIYFLKGHGEMSVKSANGARGLSEYASVLAARNYKVEELDLSETKEVPDDADMVVVAGAKSTFLPREIDALRKYLLKSNGRGIFFLEMGSLLGLEDILYEWGIMSDDMLVLDSGGDYESASGDLIARSFPKNPHPIVKYLIDSGTPVQFGSTRPVRPDLGSPIDETLKISPIVLGGPTSWGEKSYARGGMQKYDEASDLAGPFPLAMVATRTAGGELGLNIPGGKLAVFGDENFVANKWFNRLGNSKLALNVVDWMFEENNRLNIPPRPLKTFSLTLSQSDAFALAWRFLSIPAAILLLCMVVFAARRR